MKKFTFISFYLLLTPFLCFSQLVNPDKASRKIWAHDFSKPFLDHLSILQNSKDWPLDIKQTSDGGYIACGYTFEDNVGCSNNALDYVPTIIKLDANGAKQWNFSYLNGGNVHNRQFNKIIELPGNQGYAAIGHVNGGCTPKTFYVHIDLDGTILSQKLIGLAVNDNIISGGSGIVEANGNIYVSGTYFNSTISANDMMLLKMDYSGNVISSNTYHPSSFSNSNSLELFLTALWSGGTNPDGSHGSTFQGFALAGTIVNSNTPQNGTYSDPFIDMWVAETNTSGTIIWNTILNSGAGGLSYIYNTSNACFTPATKTNSDWAMDVIQNSGDKIIVATGYNFSTGYFNTPFCADDSRDYDCFLFKFDRTTGNINTNWPKHVAHFSGDDSQTDLKETYDNGYVLCGSTADAGVVNSAWGEECLIVKTNGSGTVQWSRTYHNNGNFTSGPGICCFSIFATKDRGFVMCGNNNADDDNFDFIKLGSDCQRDLVTNASQWGATDIYKGRDITGTETWSSSRKVQGTVRVKNNAKLYISGANTVISFIDTRLTNDFDYLAQNSFPGAGNLEQPTKIIVEHGGYLEINNATLTGLSNCDQSEWMWEGIQLEGQPGLQQTSSNQGEVYITNYAKIKNATIGILVDHGSYNSNGNLWGDNSGTGGFIIGNRLTFSNCRRAIIFNPYNWHNNGNFSRFYFSEFVCDNPLVDPNYIKFDINNPASLGERVGTSTFVSIWGTNNIVFRGCTFKNLYNFSVPYRSTGISVADASFYVFGNNNSTMKDFDGVYEGIHVENSSTLLPFTVNYCLFNNNYHGIFVKKNHLNAIYGNTFENIPENTFSGLSDPYGIRMQNAGGFQIGGNTSNAGNTLTGSKVGSNYGIVVTSSGNQGGTINHNNFTDLQIQNQMEDNNPILQIGCNTYHYNQAQGSGDHVWMVLPATTGVLATQGGSQPADNHPENIFDVLTCNYGAEHFKTDILFTYYVNNFNNLPTYPLCSSAILPQGSTSPGIVDLGNNNADHSCDIQEPCSPPCDEKLRAIFNTDDPIKKQLLINEQLMAYLGYDSTGTDTMAVYLLKRLNTEDANMLLVALYVSRADSSNANAILSTIPTATSEERNFHSFYNIIINLITTRRQLTDIDSAQEATLWSLVSANDDNSLNAEAALEIAGKANFDHPILKAEEDSRIGASNKLIAKESTLFTSPNPASDFTVVQYSLAEKMNNPFLVLYDILGNRIQTVKINSNSGEIKLCLTGLSKGLYNCRLINNNQNKKSCKIAVIQ